MPSPLQHLLWTSSSLVICRTQLSIVGDRVFSSHRCPSCPERTTMPRHICTVPVSFLQSSEDSLIRPCLSLITSRALQTFCSAREVINIIIGHPIVFLTLLPCAPLGPLVWLSEIMPCQIPLMASNNNYLDMKS